MIISDCISIFGEREWGKDEELFGSGIFKDAELYENHVFMGAEL